MNKKPTFAALMLAIFLLQFFPAPQMAAAASCDAAQFVADLTVPDGTTYKAGDSFEKKWRLKNIGTCTWTTDYALVFSNGDPMGAASPQKLSKSVAPGGTIDLAVTMIAPNVSGNVFGYWKLKNASGGIFGIGALADKAFWVQIRVTTGTETGTVYNFAENYSAATWTNGPGSRVDNPKLENGSTFNGAALEMIPPNTTDGFVQAQYPAIQVKSGDRFQSILNCEYQATSCLVSFRLDYQIGSGAVQTFKQFNERYEGLYYVANWDISSLAGQDVKFILRVGAFGSPSGDRALWAGPRITRAGGATSTPTPTVTGTPPTPTNTPPPHSGADRATFAADKTVPDGTAFGPNIAFTKTWSIKNTGTSTWTTAFKLVFVSGDLMSAPAEVPLASTVPPNTTIDLPSVGMVSPAIKGHYRGFWMLKNASGAPFGIGPAGDKPFWVDIIVTSSSNVTSTPTVTGTPPTPTATSAGPSKTPTPNTGPDRVTFISDQTVPDGSAFGPNTAFTKTWRLRNTGTSTWTTAYKLVFVPGAGSTQMGGPNEQGLPGSVIPGAMVDISVSLTSPSTGGTYRGYWMLKNDKGQLFGIGSTANRPFWVDILVTGNAAQPDLVISSAVTAPQGWTGGCATNLTMGVNVTIRNAGSAAAVAFVVDVGGSQQTVGAGLATGASTTLWFGKTGNLTITVDSTNLVTESNEGNNSLSYTTITATPPVTCTPGTVTVTPTPTLTPTVSASACERAAMIADVTVPDGAIFGPNVAFTKTWRLRNVGTCSWNTAYKLVFASGSQMGAPSTVNLPVAVAPNGTVDVSVNMTSPAANGNYRGNWQLKNPAGGLFGIGPNADGTFWLDITVQGGSTGPTVTPTATATSGTPTVTPTVTSTTPATGSFAVVGIKSDDVLNVRSAAGANNPLVGSLVYNATNIGRIGSPVMVGTSEWWQVQKTGGITGWVNAFYLNEYVPSATFCADAKVTTLLTNLGTALKSSDGAALALLVSPKHGVDIRLVSNNTPVNFSGTVASSLFTSTTVQNWGAGPASGDTVSGSFKDVILPKLLEVYNSSFILGCNDTSKLGPVSQPWPSEYATVNFYSIYKPATGTNLDWRDFLVGIEYISGQPYLFSLVHFQWVP